MDRCRAMTIRSPIPREPFRDLPKPSNQSRSTKRPRSFFRPCSNFLSTTGCRRCSPACSRPIPSRSRHAGYEGRIPNSARCYRRPSAARPRRVALAVERFRCACLQKTRPILRRSWKRRAVTSPRRCTRRRARGSRVALTPRRCASGESARAAAGRSLIAP